MQNLTSLIIMTLSRLQHWVLVLSRRLESIQSFRRRLPFCFDSSWGNLLTPTPSAGWTLGMPSLTCFALPSPQQLHTNYLVQSLIGRINEAITMGIATDSGISVRYNGVDLLQARDHIRLSCENCLSCILQTHGWNVQNLTSLIVMTLSRLRNRVQVLPRRLESIQSFRFRLAFCFDSSWGNLL